MARVGWVLLVTLGAGITKKINLNDTVSLKSTEIHFCGDTLLHLVKPVL